MNTAGHITRLTALYRGWGEHWPLGTLCQINGKLLFEYSPQAVARGLQFSPLRRAFARAGRGVVSVLENYPIRRATLQTVRKTLDDVWKGLRDE